MSEKLSKPPRRGRRNVVFASLAAVAAMLLASVGAATAQVPENGVGTASARGTDPDAHLGLFPVTTTTTAEFSAITNCDAAQNTRPFYVRWTENATSHVFKRTETTGSLCFTQGPSNGNQGFGAGVIDGSHPALLFWFFQDSPDSASIEINPSASGPLLSIVAEPPAAWNGTPGGVWVFGTLPWPPLIIPE